jgi:hypothetical protein
MQGPPDCGVCGSVCRFWGFYVVYYVYTHICIYICIDNIHIYILKRAPAHCEGLGFRVQGDGLEVGVWGVGDSGSVASCIHVLLRPTDGASPRKVDVRLPEKGNSNSLGARPVHLIITMIKWFRTSRLSTRNSLSLEVVWPPAFGVSGSGVWGLDFRRGISGWHLQVSRFWFLVQGFGFFGRFEHENPTLNPHPQHQPN